MPANKPFRFTVTSASPNSGELRDLQLTFPGFTPHEPPTSAPPHFHGRLHRAGFFPLQFTACTASGAQLSGRDYFLVPEPTPLETDRESGYYVFLGRGDYPLETHPLAAWTLGQWQELVMWMGTHGMNRLWVLLNGFTLAYPSQRYPELCDHYARNVTDNFLGALIDYAHAHNVQIYLMLTTDGHARNFVQTRPEAARIDAAGRPCPQFGLALEHPSTQHYMADVLDEVLALYPHADGLAIHPTESDPDRFNPETLEAYRSETGRELAATTKAERYAWYNRAYARFLSAYFNAARRRCPRLAITMANCWWQDDHVAINRAELPNDVRITIWHYAWEDHEPKPWSLHHWLAHFPPERLIYMPTSQSYLYPDDPARVMDRHIGTDRLISTAATLGIHNLVYFAGWEVLDETARLLDVALAHPSPPAPVAALYRDYFGTRQQQG